MNPTPDLLPSIDFSHLHGGLAVAEAMNDEGEIKTTIVRDLGHCTVADLKKAIAIQQREIAHAADGFQALTALLTRRLMQGARGPDLALLPTEPDAVPFPSKAYADPLDDPAFSAKAAVLIDAEEEQFQKWLSADAFDPLIDEALAAGREAYKDVFGQTAGSEGFSTFATIDLGHRRAKPLVQALRYRGVGEIEIETYTFDISADAILKKRRRRGQMHSALAAKAAVEAFALAVSRPGFELNIHREDCL